jgi:hypothetical protein
VTTPRVLPPSPPAPGQKLKGPASYFPSIEKTYGEPMQHWLDLAVELLRTRAHQEAVAALKAEHGMGHGHANAVVAYVRAQLADGGAS